MSLFIDPDKEQIARVRDCGADRIELYTGPYAATVAEKGLHHDASKASWTRYLEAARYANQIGLGVNAGHDLDLINLILFREITEIAEVSIGHALITDALEFGLTEAVTKYLAALSPASLPTHT